MKQLAMLMAVGAVVAVMGGCAGNKAAEKPEPAQEPVVQEKAAPEVVQPSDSGTAEAQPIEPTTGFQGNPLDDPDSLLSKRKIYFDFDRAEVKDEYRDIVGAHAEYLANNPGSHITLEGHADERGTREYNMALGERRANAVAQMLTLQGVSKDQIRVISYGEERPEEVGHDESAWSMNRRAVFVYLTQ